jgi:hypothetical protein
MGPSFFLSNTMKCSSPAFSKKKDLTLRVICYLCSFCLNAVLLSLFICVCRTVLESGCIVFQLRPCLVPFPKLYTLSHRIFGHMHGVLNVD